MVSSLEEKGFTGERSIGGTQIKMWWEMRKEWAYGNVRKPSSDGKRHWAQIHPEAGICNLGTIYCRLKPYGKGNESWKDMISHCNVRTAEGDKVWKEEHGLVQLWKERCVVLEKELQVTRRKENLVKHRWSAKNATVHPITQLTMLYKTTFVTECFLLFIGYVDVSYKNFL